MCSAHFPEAGGTPHESVSVCLLTESYYPLTGGGETQARILASGTAGDGPVKHVLTRRTDKTSARHEILDGVTVWRLPPSGPGHLKKWGLVVTAFFRLWRLRHEYDVILVAGYRVLGIPSVIIKGLFGKKCILKADSIGEFSGEFFSSGLQRYGLRHDRFPFSTFVALRNRLFRRADCFVTISSPVADELVDNGVRRDRIVHIPNSVDTNLFRPADPAEKASLRREIGIAPERMVGVYTGRLVHTKGLPMLLRCWQRIAPANPEALLMLVGSGGVGMQNCEEQLRDFVAEHRLQDSVVFAGSVTDVHRYLQASDFFVFPTEKEAFGISIIEAFACGLPVITTSTGGVIDIIGDGDSAIAIPVGDEVALARALESLIRGDAPVAAMATAARRIAEDRYSNPSVLQRYDALFADLTGRPTDD